jgi:hypothetical protein
MVRKAPLATKSDWMYLADLFSKNLCRGFV